MQLCSFEVGVDRPFFLIAGPCVIESEQLAIDTSGQLKEITSDLDIPFIYKSSFDKANRSSHESYRGLGIDKGLSILSKVKETIGVPVLTDVHEDTPLAEVAEVVDVLQTPAFLCRQTNFIQNVASLNLPVNIKKGQFLAPQDMKHIVEKVESTGNKKILLTERGSSFGYHNLIVDMRSLVIMREFGYPVVMDATHSVQLPSKDTTSGGEPKFIKPLARAAAAVGIDALFLEVHPDPKNALSDAASQLPIDQLEDLLIQVKEIDEKVKNFRSEGN